MEPCQIKSVDLGQMKKCVTLSDKKCGSRSDEKSVEPYQMKKCGSRSDEKVWNLIR